MSATGTESQIAEALLTRLGNLTLSPPLQVAQPSVPFGPNKPDTYLQASLLRAATQGVGVNAWDEHAGILQVDVVYGKLAGEIKPLQVADAVADWFKRGTRMVNGAAQIDIYEQPSIASSLDNGDSYMKIPVSIRYRNFTK